MSNAPVASLFLSAVFVATALGLFLGLAIRLDVPLEGPLGDISFEADSVLSAPFVILVGLIGFSSSLAGRQEPMDRTGRLLVFAFLAGLGLVPFANDVFSFFLAWEMMSAAPGFLLVLSPHGSTRRAGTIYLVYAHLAAVSILAGFLLWSGGGPGTFDVLLQVKPPPAALVLLVLGAVMKAGVMPFHVWLPEAHPAAPAHVSALMSGAMVAMPIYLLLRFVAPAGVPGPVAVTLLMLGALSAALGSLHALHERQLKRLLAMTTVAHIGTVVTLVGLDLLLKSLGNSSLHGFLVTVSLAYVVAHGLSKGALFLIAGEIHHAVHELDLERLGGLWRTLGPLAILSGLGCVALAGLLPFAGFPAEVGVFASLLASLPGLDPLNGVIVLGALFLLGVGAGANLAAVSKFTLGTFHGPPRGPRPTRPLSNYALVPPALLLAVSLLVGIAPGLLWSFLPSGAHGLASISTPLGAFSLLPFLLVATLFLLLAWTVVRAARRATVAVDPWACGGRSPTPRQTYTPQSLVMPYRILFAEILRPRSDLRLQDAPVAPFAPSKGHYEDRTPRYVEPFLHEPLQRFLVPKMERLRRLHRGPVQTYLIIALLVLVALLLILPVIP